MTGCPEPACRHRNDMRQSAQFLALTPAQQQLALSKIQAAVGAPYEAGLNYNVDNKLKTYLVKFDGNLGSSDHWSLRDNITRYDTTNSGATSSFGLNQTNETDKFYQIVLENDTVFTDRLFNQFIAQVGRDQARSHPVRRHRVLHQLRRDTVLRLQRHHPEHGR